MKSATRCEPPRLLDEVTGRVSYTCPESPGVLLNSDGEAHSARTVLGAPAMRALLLHPTPAELCARVHAPRPCPDQSRELYPDQNREPHPTQTNGGPLVQRGCARNAQVVSLRKQLSAGERARKEAERSAAQLQAQQSELQAQLSSVEQSVAMAAAAEAESEARAERAAAEARAPPLDTESATPLDTEERVALMHACFTSAAAGTSPISAPSHALLPSHESALPSIFIPPFRLSVVLYFTHPDT
eukprot:271314-Pleurochrysis_carterae.AAC.1